MYKKYDPSKTELDYRFLQKWTGRTAANLYEKKEKLKEIGKLGTSCTIIDLKTAYGKLSTYNDGNKIEAKDSFVTVRANNCLYKGKWCYEVLLESNGLFQLGFCQLKTPFTGQTGVGDDKHSFGYDGYRLSCWNQDENRYGKVWDYGDIIGVCIDLDNKHIEYYQNGEKLGIIKKNIEAGSGVAYFPGLSFSDYEKCSFNFGAYPFVYSYPGYEPIDIPKSQYNGSFEVTSQLLQCLNHSKLLDFLDNDMVDSCLKKLVNQKIFYFLINVSFKDFFLCKCLLFPFMYSLIKKNKIHYQIFLEQLSINLNLNDNKTFFNDFFEKLTNIIEEYALMGPKFYNQYQLFTELFLELISDKVYFNEWSNTRDFFGHLRNIFISNNFSFKLVYDKITEIYGDEQYNKTLGALLSKIVREGNIITKEMNESDQKYFHMMGIFIEKIFNYYENKSTLCQATFIFYDLMRACYPINAIKDYIYDLNTFIGSDNKKNIIAFKNVILSYMSYFFENYKNINLDELPIGSATVIQLPNLSKVSIKNELSKTGIYVSYFKEENIGGKSSSLINTNLHGHKFTSSDIFEGINKKSSICFNILVKLISLMDKFFFAYYEFQSLAKDYIYANYIPPERGTTLMNGLFRFYFYLFNDYCQIVLYNMSFFIIKWLNNLILSKNKLYVLLLPLYIIDFPFQIAQLMIITKSKIIYDDDYRKELNKKCALFEKDDFLQSLYTLYITLFEDENLAIYNVLTQSLGWKIFFFLREKITRQKIINNEIFINSIMKGISNIILTNNNVERIVLRILNALQRTTSEIEKEYTQEELNEEEENRKKLINILNSNEYKTIFSNIINIFCQNLNIRVITYCQSLDDCKHYCIDSNFLVPDNNKKYINTLKSALKSIIPVVNFYEFILNINSANFFLFDRLDHPLVYIRNFLVTLSTHIIGEPHFGYLKQLFNYIYIKDSNILELVNSVVNLILNCKNTGNLSFTNFIVNTRGILIKSFSDIYTYGKNELNDKIKEEYCPFYQSMIIKYEEYNKLMDELVQKRKIYEEEYLKKITVIEYLDDEYLCAICFGNIADYEIKPCLHRGCRECLLTYIVDNDKCFMCRQTFDYIEKVNESEIQKLIEDSQKTKTGNEEEENNKEINEEEKNKEANEKENNKEVNEEENNKGINEEENNKEANEEENNKEINEEENNKEANEEENNKEVIEEEKHKEINEEEKEEDNGNNN